MICSVQSESSCKLDNFYWICSTVYLIISGMVFNILLLALTIHWISVTPFFIIVTTTVLCGLILLAALGKIDIHHVIDSCRRNTNQPPVQVMKESRTAVQQTQPPTRQQKDGQGGDEPNISIQQIMEESLVKLPPGLFRRISFQKLVVWLLIIIK